MKKCGTVAVTALSLVLAMPANAQQQNTQAMPSKVKELHKVARLNENQRKKMTAAYNEYAAQCKKARETQDPRKAAKMKYNASKAYHEAQVENMTEKQWQEYVNVHYAPEIEAKTAYYISLLQENDDYGEQELEQARKDIYDFLMKEKVVYARDKYDFATQKKNIAMLKVLQPAALKYAQTIEKAKATGRFSKGKINW